MYKRQGLTLEEIASVIDLYFEDSTGIKGKQKVLEILHTHLRETDDKIEALAQFRSELQTSINKIQQCIEEVNN